MHLTAASSAYHPGRTRESDSVMRRDFVSDPARSTDGDTLKRLAAIEDRLRRIEDQLDTIAELRGRLAEINSNVSALLKILDQEIR